jgi:hypothetical protein
VKNRRKFIAKIAAPVVALLALFSFMLLPMLTYRLAVGASLEASGPNGEIMLLVIGGALGAGVAYLVYHLILTRLGGFSDHEVENMWQGKKN